MPSFSCFLCLLSKFLQDLVYVLFAECEYMAENADRDFLDLLAGIELAYAIDETVVDG